MPLKENLPKFIAEEKYIKEVLEAIEPEIDKIKIEISKMLLECCVSTCSDYGLKKFEKDFSIRYDANLTIEERRRNVINKMLAKKRLTKEGLNDFIKRNLNNGQFYVSNEAEQYSFKVRIINENLKEELYQALYKARPAHLVFDVDIVSYERRCGTFNCNGYVI